MKKYHLASLAALSVLGFSNVADAANNDKQNCAPEPGVCYSSDNCECYSCLGPDNTMVNAPARPHTCNGDFVVTLAGFYWNANQDGMEYALKIDGNDQIIPGNRAFVNVIDGNYLNPDFSWDFGFKLGLGYNTTCDGWDFGVEWTWFRNSASTHEEAENDDNRTLIPLWSAFANVNGLTLYATDIQTRWKLDLNLVDIELGREFWTSKYLTFRPFVGLRVAYIKQDYEIEHRGGAWRAVAAPLQPALNNRVDLKNDFKGVGVRGGFDTVWNLGCGWGLYGDLAASIIYGRFTVEHNEYNRLATDTHDKTKILETDYSFRASRAIFDTALGVQWSTMFCACSYGLTLQLGWEHHLFFDQNQMWRVQRTGDAGLGSQQTLPNNTGENTFYQRRGDLSTQGWTFTVRLEF